MGLKFLVEDIHDGLDFMIEEKNRQRGNKNSTLLGHS